MSTDSEDERWLDALGGKSPNSARPSAAEREATAIRRAVLRQIEARPSFEPSQARLDMLMAEANRQGLLSKERSSWGAGAFIDRIYQILAMPGGVFASIALILGLSVTVGYQAHQSSIPESQIVRKGGPAERVPQIVPSPLEAAQDWQRDLLAAGIEYAVSYEKPGRVLIRVRLTPEAIELLQTRSRIQAPPGEWVTLVIETGKKDSP
jgi:hypothetical protein